MEFIKRAIEQALARYKQFPVVAILGPRQSGKTTLAQHYFKNHTFLSFEKPGTQEFARTDPEGFLHEHENKYGLILDEFQYVPELLSYIQLEVDAKKRPGYFVLTGSQNFLMNEAVTQSLAGRVGILTLLPLSLHELQKSNLLAESPLPTIIKGGYPRVYTEKINVSDLYSSYIHTYIERDVRLLSHVGDLSVFQKFMMLCAGRIGQELNLTDIGSLCGVTAPTVKKWLSILEASYIAFLLPPYFKNFDKRLVKTPKLYFYDTGVACNLLSIHTESTLLASPFRGHLFENLIISDFAKQWYNNGRRPPLYFWRDANDRVEVDCLVDIGDRVIPVEIKASQTSSLSFFDALTKWNDISATSPNHNYVVYAGHEHYRRKQGNLIGWHSAGDLIKELS